MTQFQKGDRIVFIDPNGAGHSEAVNGREYTVGYMMDDLVHTVEGIYAFSSRFKLVTPAAKVINPLDFTNLELRTLAHISAQGDLLDKDVVEKTEALNAAIKIKEAFTKTLNALGIAIIAGGLETAPVVPPVKAHPLSGRVFSSLSPTEVKKYMTLGTEVRFTGSDADAEESCVDAKQGDIFKVTEFDPWDNSVLVEKNDEDCIWLFSADDDYENFFVVV